MTGAFGGVSGGLVVASSDISNGVLNLNEGLRTGISSTEVSF